MKKWLNLHKIILHMLKIGKYNTLRVARNVDFGAYLQDADGNEVLLPSRYIVNPLPAAR